MADTGDILDSFPESPIPTRTLTQLEQSDRIRTAIPLVTEEHGAKELSRRVVIQTDAVAVVAAYSDEETESDPAGWRIVHRVDADGRDPDAVFEEAMVAGQGESSFVEPPADES